MVEKKINVLIIEDDHILGVFLKKYLETEKFRVDLKNNALEGYAAFKNKTFDLIILDVMMPGKDGFTLAKEIRQEDQQTPIIFLTAKSMAEDKIAGFESGGDDYITKPFNSKELLLRINSILNRSKFSLPFEKQENIRIGDYSFDYNNQLLIFQETPYKKLTNKEADMLYMLYIYKNKTLPRQLALRTIWGEDDYFMGRSMDVYIAKLRKILNKDQKISIINIHNKGFKLEVRNTL